MMSLAGINAQPAQERQERCLVAQQELIKGMLFGHISNGGGVIPLGRDYSLSIVALDERRCVFQLFRNGIGSRVVYQTWQKAKMMAPPKPTMLKEKLEVTQGELI